MGIEPQSLPIGVARKYLAAMVNEIRSDFPKAVIDGIKVARVVLGKVFLFFIIQMPFKF